MINLKIMKQVDILCLLPNESSLIKCIYLERRKILNSYETLELNPD